MKTVVTKSAEETEAFGQYLAPLLKPGDVIAFYGDLGAGKTTFVRGLARGMDSSEPVSSPTFVIMHIYEGRLPIYHFDAYRLTGAQDLWNIGADEYIDGDGVACIEWSERAEEVLPPQRLMICMRRVAGDPQGRILEVTGIGQRGEELEREISFG